MAVVLSPEESNSFSSSLLRRSHLQPKFIASQASEPSSKSKNSSGFNTINLPANPTSSPNVSPPKTLHANSAPLCISNQDDQVGEDQIIFPYSGQIEDLSPPASPGTSDFYAVSQISNFQLLFDQCVKIGISRSS